MTRNDRKNRTLRAALIAGLKSTGRPYSSVLEIRINNLCDYVQQAGELDLYLDSVNSPNFNWDTLHSRIGEAVVSELQYIVRCFTRITPSITMRVAELMAARRTMYYNKLNYIASRSYPDESGANLPRLRAHVGGRYVYIGGRYWAQKAFKRLYEDWGARAILDTLTLSGVKGMRALFIPTIDNPSSFVPCLMRPLLGVNRAGHVEVRGVYEDINRRDYFWCNFSNGFWSKRHHRILDVHDYGEVCERYAGKFYYSHEHAMYFRNESAADDYSPSYLESYHSDTSARFLSFRNDWDGFRVGIEIEKEDEDILESVTIAKFRDMTDKLYRKESDGSLDERGGFELITPVYDYDVPKIMRHIRENNILLSHINADGSYSNCGAHMNVSHEQLSARDIYARAESFFPLLFAMYPKRTHNRYTKAKSKHDMLAYNEKYQAVQLKSNLVEFRIFPFLKNDKQLEFRLELLKAILDANATTHTRARAEILSGNVGRILRRVYTGERIKELAGNFDYFAVKYGFSDSVNESQMTDFENNSF